MTDDLEDPETFCNPIQWMNEAEELLEKWAQESNT